MEALLGDQEIRNKTTKVSGTGEENIFCCLLDLDDLSVEYFLVNLVLGGTFWVTAIRVEWD